MNTASRAARERWRRVLEHQQRSGLSVARFCREQQIAESSLFAWRRRLAREAGTLGTPSFVAITAAATDDHMPKSAGGAIELHLGDGRHLVLRPGFDAATLAAALGVLAEGR
jgi:hypothetical protein